VENYLLDGLYFPIALHALNGGFLMKNFQSLFTLCLLAAMLFAPSKTQGADGSLVLKPRVSGGILLLSTDDGAFQWWFDGRVYLDAAFYMEDKTDKSDGTELRRGRFALKTIFFSDWYAEIDVDFASDTETDVNAPQVKDAYIAWRGLNKGMGHVKMGNFKTPFSMEEVTTSRYLTFMERGLPNAFPAGRKLGIEAAIWSKSYRLAAGLFGEDVDTNPKTRNGEDEGFGYATRLTAAPVNEDGKLLHFGLGWMHRTADAGSRMQTKFRTRPETHVDRTRTLDTGTISDVRYWNVIGTEVAAIYGPFSFQSEFMGVDVMRQGDSPDLKFGGYYATLTYFLTKGDHRVYNWKEAEFTSITPASATHGAIELALRMSTLDLSDENVWGGNATAYTLGATWYPNRNLRVLANYTLLDHDEAPVAGDDDFSVAQVRILAAF
jgi:phosphate-selective porin OprO and OprP